MEEQDKERIDFVNIAEDSFDPKRNNNISYDDAMSTIHAITLEGRTVKGVRAHHADFIICCRAVGPVWPSRIILHPDSSCTMVNIFSRQLYQDPSREVQSLVLIPITPDHASAALHWPARIACGRA